MHATVKWVPGVLDGDTKENWGEWMVVKKWFMDGHIHKNIH